MANDQIGCFKLIPPFKRQCQYCPEKATRLTDGNGIQRCSCASPACLERARNDVIADLEMRIPSEPQAEMA